jgi:hypothetical protein
VGEQHDGRQIDATLLALVLISCGAESQPSELRPESQPPELRPEFASVCGMPGSVAPGLEQCQNGVRHRLGPIVCPARGRGQTEHSLYQVYQYQVERGLNPECGLHAMCSSAPYGRCEETSRGELRCRYGCSTDAECGPGQACNCQNSYGACVPASCTSDASCAPGFACTSWDDGCSGSGYACEQTEDECASHLDCAEGLFCIWDSARRVCAAQPVCSEDAG